MDTHGAVARRLVVLDEDLLMNGGQKKYPRTKLRFIKPTRNKNGYQKQTFAQMRIETTYKNDQRLRKLTPAHLQVLKEFGHTYGEAIDPVKNPVNFGPVAKSVEEYGCSKHALWAWAAVLNDVKLGVEVWWEDPSGRLLEKEMFYFTGSNRYWEFVAPQQTGYPRKLPLGMEVRLCVGRDFKGSVEDYAKYATEGGNFYDSKDGPQLRQRGLHMHNPSIRWSNIMCRRVLAPEKQDTEETYYVSDITNEESQYVREIPVTVAPGGYSSDVRFVEPMVIQAADRGVGDNYGGTSSAVSVSGFNLSAVVPSGPRFEYLIPGLFVLCFFMLVLIRLKELRR